MTYHRNRRRLRDRALTFVVYAVATGIVMELVRLATHA